MPEVWAGVKRKRSFLDLCVAVGIFFALFVLYFLILFIDAIHDFFSQFPNAPMRAVLANLLFLWLGALLWLAFRRWHRMSADTNQLESVISAISPDALLVIDSSRTIVLCNTSVERIFGYTPEEVLHRKTDRLYGDRRTMGGSRHHEIHDALERDGFHIGLATGKRKDGSNVPLEIISGTSPDREGAVLLLRDISERVRAEEERRDLEARMRQQQKLESLGALAGGIAHDFNNLLMIVEGHAGLALKCVDPSSPAHESLEGIEMAAQSAAELCKQMLTYSGQRDFTAEPLDLSAVVRDMERLLKISVPDSVLLETDLGSELPPIRGDIIQIHQIVMNLVKNAADAIGKQRGVIRVGTGFCDCAVDELTTAYLDYELPAGRYVLLEVADSGCGMDEETKAKLFDPFYTTKIEGRGLGLSTVLGIVRGHRGVIRVTSAPGEGTTFAVLFPCGDLADEAGVPASTPTIVDAPEAAQTAARRSRLMRQIE